ncbi:MAG: glycosyltransferase family 39 protein [Candidatus Riflebacteria bacterium]|nr:glycosyltransferase family 39 protein [Candidatus Riflebacteria bacterium]
MNKSGKTMVWLACVAAAVAIYFGFFGLERTRMETLYVDYTWYFVAAALFVWLQQLFTRLPTYEVLNNGIRRHALPIVTAFALTVAGFLASPPDFRILADETNLLGMSMAMYDDHACYNPTQAVSYYHGMNRVISRVTDMRPGGFPFMVSALHSLTGYRGSNAFAVNAIAGFLSMLLLYYLVQMPFGRFWGITAMLLLASYPVFLLYMTSAGFEVFNLMTALIFLVLLDRFIRRPAASSAESMLLLLPLLAQTRYESALAVLCALPVVFLRLPAAEYAHFSLRLVIWPLLFMPAAWLRLVTFSQQAFQVKEIDQAFGFDLFVKNIQKALPFFTGSERAYGMVPVITFFAVAGLVWLLLDWQLRRQSAKDPLASASFSADQSMLLFSALFFALHAAARFAYFWGDMTLQYTSRLGIIFLPVLVFLSVYLMRRLTNLFALGKNWAVVGAFLLLIHCWPVAGQNLAVRDILFFREFKTVREFLQREYPDKKDYIVVTEQSNALVPLRYNSFSVGHLNANLESVKRDLKNRTWRYLLLVQKIETESGKAIENSGVSADLVLETLYESQLSVNRILRISKYRPE